MPKQNVPALRLEGFSGEWGTTIVSAVADVVGGGTPSTSNPSLWDGDIDWYSPNEVGSDVVAKPSNRRITVEGLRASSAQLLPAHRTILYTSRASIGHTAILKHPATTNQGFQSLVLRDGMDTYFMYSLTPLITRKALKISSGSTFLEISAKALGTIEIPVPPTLEEQQAIGAIFTNLDAAINQHMLKHKALQQSKTALMQRMFPQEGQTVPELRLEGFSGEWGSAPLQQLASLFTDGDWIESKDQSTEGIRLLQTGNVGIGTFVQKSATQKWISEETFKRLRCQEVLPGDILISRLPDPAGRACIVPMMPYRLITAVDCTIVRLSEENDADYLVAYLGNPSYFEHIDTLLAGGTRQRVSRSQLAAIEVPVPPTLEEQQAIGAVFTNLDQLIAAEAQYIASLKQAKTALLQRMFI